MGKFNEVDYSTLAIYDKNEPSKKLARLIKETKERDFEVDEHISVHRKIFDRTTRSNDSIFAQIKSIDGDKFTIERYGKQVTVNREDIEGKPVYMIGASPFIENDGIRPVAYQLSSILYSTGILAYESVREAYTAQNAAGEKIPIMGCNFNPFIYVNGEKQYYQRDFVWTMRDCQNLIESIYQGIDCGKVVLRQRSFGELHRLALQGETELAFKDVVDGKQRLTAIAKFIRNEYKDLHGNYFGDLSPSAKNGFYDHQLISFAEMGEETTDEAVLRQFLKMNHFGVPQSKEHIEFVRSLYGKPL